MSVSRRFFLKSSCGAVVAVAASQFIVSHFFENTQSSRELVKNTIKKRFPNVDFSGTALDEFADMIVQKDASIKGSSSFSLNEILDENEPTITFERYVTREFILNTNYMSHKLSNYPGLTFTPFELQHLSPAA